MTVIATVTVPTTDFALGRVLGGISATRIDLEQLVPIGDTALPYFWIETTDSAAVVATLLEADVVADASVVDELGGKALIRVDWTDEIDGLLENLVSNEAVVLDAHGTVTEWEFQLRFASYECLSAFYRDCIEDDIALELTQVHNPVEDGASRTRFGLTPIQQETLTTALDAGYFTVPREVTLAELGKLMGVSDAATSERLRRGQTTLLTATLLAGAASPPADADS